MPEAIDFPGHSAGDILEDAVAIVGIGCRFPGAADYPAFVELLEAGRHGRVELSDDDLLREGVANEVFARSNYVRAAYPLPGFDRFDAPFFGFSAADAVLLDPQQRVFLEVAWHALEDAGLNLDRDSKNIGVFAGSNISTYLMFHLLPSFNTRRPAEGLEMLLANDKDYVATRLSYKLDLRGPSMTIQSACSTSLTAVCQACASLLAYECDAALAGGVAIRTPHRAGYIYEVGGVTSPDGFCRPFDINGQGTIFSNGAGVIVLKRLATALADGDRVHAVIRGFATSNDGAGKVGFTAPGVAGQAAAIQSALNLAELSPDSVGYIEAHGTGTPIGDPIEVAALARVYGRGDARAGPCFIGSVKSNIGHCDSAAGIAGLIKAVTAISRGMIPATLNFARPNPALRLDETPFKVCSARTPWPDIPGLRRAGVSSFGIGGTNAHVILEQAPPRAAAPAGEPGWQIVVASARSERSMDDARLALATHLTSQPDLPLAKIAASSVAHRAAMPHRAAVVARTSEEAARLISGASPREGAPFVGVAERQSASGLCMMFSGQIPVRRGVGRELLAAEPALRSSLEACLDLLHDRVAADAVQRWFNASNTGSERNLEWWSPVATFCLQHGLAEVWKARGASPSVVFGHSLGEYAAAVMAGVMDLSCAVNAVRERSWLMHFRTRPGAMLLVNASRDAVRTWLDEDLPAVSISAVNSPTAVTLSGEIDEIERYSGRLQARGARFDRLSIPYAGHCHVMDPMLPEFEAWFERQTLRAPAIPMLRAMRAVDLEVSDIRYWIAQVRRPVEFSSVLEQAVAEGRRAFLEVSSTATLSLLGQMRWPERQFVWACSMHKEFQEVEQLARATAQLWTHGDHVSLAQAAGQLGRPSYESLPLYSFETKRYWRDAPGVTAAVDEDQVGQPAPRTGRLRARMLAEAAEARIDLLAEWLRGRIGELIGEGKLDVEALHAGFFDLGINSLKVVALASELSDELEMSLPSTLLFENPTIIGLAQTLVTLVAGTPHEIAIDRRTDADLMADLERALGDRS